MALSSDLSGLRNDLAQIDFKHFSYAEQRVQRGITQIPFNKTHDRVREAGTLRDDIHGKSLLVAFFAEQTNHVGNGGLSMSVF